MKKKGFTLIELLVSIVIISLVLAFITSFVINLKDQKGSIDFNVQDSITRTSISKELNEFANEYKIESIVRNSDKKITINYKNGVVGVLEINGNTLKYFNDSNLVLVKSLTQKDVKFEQINYYSGDENYYKSYSNKKFFRYVIKTSLDQELEASSMTATESWGYSNVPTSTNDNQTSCTPIEESCSSNLDVVNSHKKITCEVSTWNRVGKECKATSYSFVKNNPTPTVQQNCTNSVVSLPSTCSAANVDKTYITACRVNCRKNATATNAMGKCFCVDADTCRGATCDIGSFNTENRCLIACNNLGGSVSQYVEPMTVYTCSEGELLNNSCYKYNQTSCASGWGISAYRPETSTCIATYEFSNINDTTNVDCTSDLTSTEQVPSICSQNAVGSYLTSCQASKYIQQTYTCEVTTFSNVQDFVTSLHNDIEVIYYGN